jgi:IclR family transcriptional regulator, pca regulon regulatory protein
MRGVARDVRTAGAEGPRRSGAETARKVLELLLYFSLDRPTATVKALAEASGLPLATAHRYVALLREMGLIEQAGPATYQLGWRVYQLARSAQAGSGLLPIAEPWMRKLVAQTDETVTLLQLAGAEMQCIGQVEPAHMVRITMEPGQLLPLTAGASARVLLAALQPDERAVLLDRLEAADPDFAARRKEFEREIEETARRGWATSQEEIDRGVWAVAVPITHGSHTVAALSVAGPLYRLEPGIEDRVVDLVLRAAAKVSEALTARAAA